MVVALLVVRAAGTVDAGAVPLGRTGTDEVVAGAVVEALEVTVALVVWAAELARANETFGVDGPVVNGLAMAPTAPRLRSPPAITPIFTLVLSNLHRPTTPRISRLLGLPHGLDDSGAPRRGRCAMHFLSHATEREERRWRTTDPADATHASPRAETQHGIWLDPQNTNAD